ncbi:tyrosine--tRNA ligase [Ruminococcaceae bacterium OttesenSCG-928-A16]|nr:tyrosine--tRNA ligase [Ruminococcaceae bacterium OttesenSCG-928-A16]
MSKNVFDTLEERGLVAQATDAEAIRKLLGSEPITFYIGFDATADSLHVGHFLQLVVMRHLQKAGHKPIALLGGATTLIGDPSGKSDMRKMLTREDIDHNAECFKKQMSKFVDFSEGKAMMVNNADWLLSLNYLEFMRDIGVHFSVNKMLATDAFKARLERGLSFMEFNYMLLQSYDFLHLYRTLGCKMQFGGNDQWANIIGGVNLVRQKERGEAFGLTFTLLTTKEGKKMGKTEAGAVWLDPEKTSPYEFFQYWRNIDDGDVQNCMKLLTDIPMDEINAIDITDGKSINGAKEKLAHTLTSTVHSPEEADKALETARSLFAGAGSNANMPSTTIEASQLQNGQIGLLDLMLACGIIPSKGEGRRLVEQGGVSVDDEKITDATLAITAEQLQAGIIIRKGKKVYHKAILQ